MAAKIGSIYVALDVDVGRVSKFRDAANSIDRDSRRMRTSLGQTSRSVGLLQNQMTTSMRSRMFGDAIKTISRTNDELSRLKATFLALSAITGTGLGGALGATFLLQTADRAKRLQNSLKTVTESHEELYAVQSRLYTMSQNTRSSFQATATIYARTARAAETLGVSQEKILRVTETIQKAFAVGGASQQEAAGAAVQLSQAIASNRFSGDEFRSVAENAPVLLGGIAKSLGVNIGKLREMGQEGMLTSEMVIKGILGASKEIDREFAKTTMTVGQSLTQLDNAFLMYIGGADESLGITRRLSGAISALAQNFGEVAKYAGPALGFGAALFGGRMASGFVGKTVNSIGEQRKAHADAIDALRKEKLELKAQGEQLAKNVAATRLKTQIALQSAVAEGMEVRQMTKFQELAARNEAKINGMRAEGAMIMQRQLAIQGEMAAIQRKGSVLSRAGSGILGFFGGWTGVALTAAIGGIMLLGDNAARAQERTASLKEELYALGIISADAAGAVEETAKSLEELSRLDLERHLSKVNDELDAMTEGQNVVDIVFQTNKDNLSTLIEGMKAQEFWGSDADKAAAKAVEQMLRDAQDGKLIVGDIAGIFDQIAVTNISGPMVELIGRAKVAIEYFNGLLIMQQRLNGELGAAPRGQDRPRGAVGAGRRRVLAGQQATKDYTAEQLRIAGLGERDAAIEKAMAAYVKDLPSGAIKPGADELRQIATQIVDLEASTKSAGKASDDAAKATEKYNDELGDLANAIETAPLGKFYQDVLKNADSLGIAKDEIDGFIAALKSGDLSSAPQKMRDLADAMRDVNAAKLEASLSDERATMFLSGVEGEIFNTLRDAGIDLNSVQGQSIANQMRLNDLLGEARDLAVDFGQTFRQSFANRLLAGETELEEAKIAHVSELLQKAGEDGTAVTIQQRKSILEMADALAEAEHGATALQRVWKAAWGAMGDAAAKVLETVAGKLMELGVNGALQGLLGGGGQQGGGGTNIIGMLLQGLLGGMVGGGMGTIGVGGVGIPSGGFIPGITGPLLMHTGGVVGSGAGMGHGRRFDPAMFASAPRFHKGTFGAGLLPGEMPAVLRRGEVVDPGDGSVFADTFGMPSISIKIDARGAQQGVGAEIKRELRDFSKHELPRRWAELQRNPNKR